AREVVRPVVVDARELLLRASARLHADERAAVRAAVLEAAQRPAAVARDHDRHVADEGRLEVTRRRKLGVQPDEAPGRAAEDKRLLPGVDFLVLVDPVRDARVALGGPGALRGRGPRHGPKIL